MKAGDIVRYCHPEPGEQQFTFVVIEINGDRALIESLDFPSWPVKPQELVATSDIEPADDAELPRAARRMWS